MKIRHDVVENLMQLIQKIGWKINRVVDTIIAKFARVT